VEGPSAAKGVAGRSDAGVARVPQPAVVLWGLLHRAARVRDAGEGGAVVSRSQPGAPRPVAAGCRPWSRALLGRRGARLGRRAPPPLPRKPVGPRVPPRAPGGVLGGASGVCLSPSLSPSRRFFPSPRGWGSAGLSTVSTGPLRISRY